MAEWKMQQLLRLLEAGGKVTITIEIPAKGETEDEDDSDKYRAGTTDPHADSEGSDTGGTDGGAASE